MNNTYYEEIKDHLIRNEINHRIKDYSKNKSDLETYYNVGKLLIIAQGGEKRAKYGDGLIKEYSERLSKEIGPGYTFTALTRMKKFYLLSQKVATPSQLSWSHYIELLTLKDNNDNKTIGIIICKHDNKTYIEYSTDKRIQVREFVLN